MAKCLLKYQWVKLPRDCMPMGKGLLGYWLRLASRAAFRKGEAHYCGHVNQVVPGMWAGGIVGLKRILGVKNRGEVLRIMDKLQELAYISYTLDSSTKKLEYRILDWVIQCSGAECMSGTAYTTEGYGFLCLPRSISQRLAEQSYIFSEADAWLDLWCHTIWRDPRNAFSFLAPTAQFGAHGAVLTLETSGQRWGWEKTKAWRFFESMGMPSLCTVCLALMAVSFFINSIQLVLRFHYPTPSLSYVFWRKYAFREKMHISAEWTMNV